MNKIYWCIVCINYPIKTIKPPFPKQCRPLCSKRSVKDVSVYLLLSRHFSPCNSLWKVILLPCKVWFSSGLLQPFLHMTGSFDLLWGLAFFCEPSIVHSVSYWKLLNKIIYVELIDLLLPCYADFALLLIVPLATNVNSRPGSQLPALCTRFIIIEISSGVGAISWR